MPNTYQDCTAWSCNSHTGKTDTELRLYLYYWWPQLHFIHSGINQDAPKLNHGFRQKIKCEWRAKGQIPVCSNPLDFSAIPKVLLSRELVPPAIWNHWEPCLCGNCNFDATESNFWIIFSAHFLCCPLTELGCYSQAVSSSFCFFHTAATEKALSLPHHFAFPNGNSAAKKGEEKSCSWNLAKSSCCRNYAVVLKVGSWFSLPW